MPAPAPETERFLRKREVADMIAASGVDLADIRFDGATVWQWPVERERRAASCRVRGSCDACERFSFAVEWKTPNRRICMRQFWPVRNRVAAQLSDEELAAAKGNVRADRCQYVKVEGGKVGRDRIAM